MNKLQGFKLPKSQYIRQSQLIPFIVPFSSATLWRKVGTGEFPRPVKLSERITAWRVVDVEQWLESKAKEGAAR
jgi:predicted DNA-binding transcriptional regulator AlpA